MKKCLLVFLLVLSLVFGSVAMSFGAVDQDVTVVNPVNGSAITSSSLLVSIKLTQPKTIKVSVYEVRRVSGDSSVALGESDMKAINQGTYQDGGSLTYVPLVAGESFTSTNNLSFYTKNLENRSPGVYYIKVDTVYQNKAVYSRKCYVTIKNKEESKLLDSSQSGTATFLQNLIKSIFN
ncbi:hypothetical protein Ami103574_00660 [Aminipila butyrica]|uniref:Uncharacterized protein n=1 Tax=Aminipila butyrica TaxID=433296 RepID=A0A858BS81_9FIRM|nr:hypothetical protein [Aminipila butyrica]QIB67908.1 hypothetical protein Ami103574_00660 [Aminipila butyrica]